MTFWDHLEELRGVLFRIVGVVALFTIIGFCFKDQLFAVVLAPKESDFIFYRFLCRLSELLGMPGLCPGEFSSTLINTQLAGQFMMHAMVSIYAGLIVASPYVIYKLFHFISPALYENERKYSVRVVTSGYLLFIIGVLVNYFIIFPLTFRFLASYQVSLEVQNTIMLSSYVDTLMLLSLLMGIVFEIPVVCWFFTQLNPGKSEIDGKVEFDRWLYHVDIPRNEFHHESDLDMWFHFSKYDCLRSMSDVAARLLCVGTSESNVERLISIHRFLVHERMTNLGPDVLLARLRLRAKEITQEAQSRPKK